MPRPGPPDPINLACISPLSNLIRFPRIRGSEAPNLYSCRAITRIMLSDAAAWLANYEAGTVWRCSGPRLGPLPPDRRPLSRPHPELLHFMSGYEVLLFLRMGPIWGPPLKATRGRGNRTCSPLGWTLSGRGIIGGIVLSAVASSLSGFCSAARPI